MWVGALPALRGSDSGPTSGGGSYYTCSIDRLQRTPGRSLARSLLEQVRWKEVKVRPFNQLKYGGEHTGDVFQRLCQP